MSPATRRDQRAWERKATSRRLARRAELRAWGRSALLLVVIFGTLATLVVAGLSTI